MIIKDWQYSSPNGRQLESYCGECGFEHVRFAKGRGRSEFRLFQKRNQGSLRSFLLGGAYAEFPAIRVKAIGYKSRMAARVVYDHENFDLAIVAENGAVVYRVSAPPTKVWSTPEVKPRARFELVRFAKGRGRAEFRLFHRGDENELAEFLREGEYLEFPICNTLLRGHRLKEQVQISVGSRIELVTKRGAFVFAVSSTV